MARFRKPIFDSKKAQGPISRSRDTIIVDSMSVGYGAYYGIKAKLASQDDRTEIIYGFLETLLYLHKMFGTRRFAFMFDSRHSYRKKRHNWYKRRTTVLKGDMDEKEIKKKAEQDVADEKEKEAIHTQFGELRSFVLPAMGFTNIKMQRGIEADDLIASAVATNKGPHTVVSTDEDLYQLLDHCTIWNQRKKLGFTKEWFIETYGITPKQWVLVKQLAGCTSDKIPGIPGVGPKTAIAFIKKELKSGKKLDGIVEDMAKDSTESVCGRNQYLVELPIPETRAVTLSFDSQRLSEEGFGEVCSAYSFRFLERSTRQGWLSFLNG